MSNINQTTPLDQQIDRILDMRLGRGEFKGKGHLQKVEDKITELENIRKSIVSLQSCKSMLDSNMGDNSNEFCKALCASQDSMSAYNQLNFVDVLGKIDAALADLEKLKKRFERQAVRIAFIGYERQGKSTFLQSMTGLPNEVIPAYDGTSCTGAVSVIHNDKDSISYRAEVQFYTLAEFLNIVKTKLKTLFPEKNFNLNSLDDLDKIDISDYKGNNRHEIEALIKTGYIGHKNYYGSFLGKGQQVYDNKDEIMKFVAQYREYNDYDSIPKDANKEDIKERDRGTDKNGKVLSKVWRHMYYWYIAVKSVDIYCAFPNPKCGRIEFVDTIGLGPSINADAVEEEMFRVLKEDCDGAIDVYSPSSSGGAITINESQIYQKLVENLASLSPQLWMSYAINKFYGEKDNTQNIKDIYEELKNRELPFSQSQIKAICAKEDREVNDELLVPHLTMLAENLPVLDKNRIDMASVKYNQAYIACKALAKLAMKVIPLGAVSDWNFETDGYEQMLHEFNVAMNKLDHDGYAKKKDVPCKELVDAYKSLIGEIDKGLPSEEELLNRFLSGSLLAPHTAFEEAIEEMRNGVFDVFENVNQKVLYPLQEKVKSELINVLYTQGLWSRLPLSGNEKNLPTTQWLEHMVKEYIPKEKYPNLYEAMRYILDYRINIEGLVEYNVTKSLHFIERDHEEFQQYSGDNPNEYKDKAEAVWQELASRLPKLQSNLQSWIEDFSLIPSQLFYSRIHKFHVKIGTNASGKREFKDFYNANMGYVWHDEINAKSRENATFNQWRECVDALRESLNVN